jgi:hypothetical protein
MRNVALSSLSSSPRAGLDVGHCCPPLLAPTGVRIPYGTPTLIFAKLCRAFSRLWHNGSGMDAQVFPQVCAYRPAGG